MTTDTNSLQGNATELGGHVKETAGAVTGDRSLQSQGVADQISGKVQQGYGAARGFARQRPFAAATLAGVVGLALINTLRGRR